MGNIESKFELQWWFDNLQSYTKYPIIIDDASVLADAQISSDASGLGYFSVSLNQNVKLKSAPFTQSQSEKSSTWRELYALHQTWTDESICIKFKGLTVKHFTDSKSVSNILVKGSKVLSLNSMVRDIFLSVRKFYIKLVPVWISRDDHVIELCDRGSREYRSDDYSLTSVCIANILSNFPKVTFDGMASSTNAIVSKFYSRYPSLNSCGVDFFSQKLDYSEFFYLFPPVSLCVNVTRYLASQEARGILIIPLWPFSVWFNFFFSDGAHCSSWVQKMFVFSPNFIPNLNSPSCFAEVVTFQAVALQFDFRKVQLCWDSIVSSDFCIYKGCNLC